MVVIILNVKIKTVIMSGVMFVMEIMEYVVVLSKEVQVVGLDAPHAIKKNLMSILMRSAVVQ